jgi:hypothetical protein
MVRDKSWMKQDEIDAHSSGRSGGDRRVFDFPGAGVLQTMATATVFIHRFLGSTRDFKSADKIEEQVVRILKAR